MVQQSTYPDVRQRMIDDMRVRNYSPRTIGRYIECLDALHRYFGRCPSQLTTEDIRRFQIHLAVELERSFECLNQTVCSLRFLYRVTLPRVVDVQRIAYARRRRKLPVVLNVDEVRALLDRAEQRNEYAVLATFYGTGVRLSELRFLRRCDVDVERGSIRVHGKGGRDRLVPLPIHLRNVLREHQRESVESTWLFPGQRRERPLDSQTIQKLVGRVAKRAGIEKHVTPRVLRHTFATHLLEAGADLPRIQYVLGHTGIVSTTVYLHLATHFLERLPHPLDRLVATNEACEMEVAGAGTAREMEITRARATTRGRIRWKVASEAREERDESA